MKTLPTTIFQILCRIIHNYKDVVKSIIISGDNFLRNIVPLQASAHDTFLGNPQLIIMKILPTTLLQNVLEIILYFKDIVKSIIDPDDNSWVNFFKHGNVN